jgi:hypothetical protein
MPVEALSHKSLGHIGRSSAARVCLVLKCHKWRAVLSGLKEKEMQLLVKSDGLNSDALIFREGNSSKALGVEVTWFIIAI